MAVGDFACSVIIAVEFGSKRVDDFAGSHVNLLCWPLVHSTNKNEHNNNFERFFWIFLELCHIFGTYGIPVFLG